MSIKLIYVRIAEKQECIEFGANITTNEDLKETLRSAAEANANDILKLYNNKGHLVSISSTLPANTPNDPYRLEVIVKNIGKPYVDNNNDLRELVERIEQLEFQLHSLSTASDYKKIGDLHAKVKDLCNKLENLEHLSWLGLFKKTRFYAIGNSLLPDKSEKKEKLKTVFDEFKKFSLVKVSDETRQYLKQPSFDNWKFHDAEMLVLLQQMFVDLDLTVKFAIKIETLQQYLFEVYANYNNVPFHNFRHAFTVTQMMYGLISITKLTNYFQPLEILALLVSALSHDLDHDGYNNSFQINAQTHLALIYNDISPLEMYHCAVGFNVLGKPNCNILSSLDRVSYKKFREYMIQIILATDMSNHNQILGKFKTIEDEFDMKNADHRLQLMRILMKTSDISNECRPINVSQTWLDCLLLEFFNQGDHERLNGLPLTPMTDRNTYSRANSQINFISYVVLPLAQSLAKVFPQLNSAIIEPIRESLEYYKNMQNSKSVLSVK